MRGTQNKPKIQPGSIKGRLLLLSLIFVIVVHPLFEGRPGLLNLLLFTVLIVAIYVVSARERWWFITRLGSGSHRSPRSCSALWGSIRSNPYARSLAILEAITGVRVSPRA